MSNTQVAPVMKMSIPRLEPQACLLDIRLAEFIKKEMEFKERLQSLLRMRWYCLPFCYCAQ